MKNQEARFEKLLSALENLGLDGFLVSHIPNLQYIFGFTGSTGSALIYRGEATLLVDSRYIQHAEDDSFNCVPLLVKRPLDDGLDDLLSDRSVSGRIGVEARNLDFKTGRRLSERFDALHVTPTENVIESLRARKDNSEKASIRKAFKAAKTAWNAFLRHELRGIGVSEVEAAGLLEFECRKAGSQGIAFETIVASGSRSALPHGTASEKVIAADDNILVDFGLRIEGYCSDMTRMIQPVPPEVVPILDTVRQAQQAAISEVNPGVSVRDVDSAAREVIEKAGFSEYFGHGTGHGLGLEVHEAPHISPMSDEVLEEGMVITIEPGIYLPGRFGVRVEDVVLVKDKGYELLSRD